MNNLEKIDFAIKETLLAHPDFDMRRELPFYFNTGSNNLFTKRNGARNCMMSLSKYELEYEIIKNAFKIAILYQMSIERNEFAYASSLPNNIPCLKIYRAFKNGINPFLYLKSNPECKNEIVKSFAVSRYYSDKKYDRALQFASLFEEEEKQLNDCLHEVLEIKNVNICRETVNKCREDILQGRQIKNTRNEYSLGDNLYAVNDVGKYRSNQEDSILILTHPLNKDFKLMVVSDGMGGYEGGEFASTYVVSKLMNWFENINVNYFNDPNRLAQEFNRIIINTSINYSKEIATRYDIKDSGATFTGAIVCNNKTIIGNVGDSRAYEYKNGELFQLTKDDSYVQSLYDIGEIRTKDEMRFHEQANAITSYMGSEYRIEPKISVINNDYDTLLLFSDGITDCLSDEQIKFITKSTPKDSIAKCIVDAAKTNTSYNRHPKEGYRNQIPAGKDNESAIAYSRGR